MRRGGGIAVAMLVFLPLVGAAVLIGFAGNTQASPSVGKIEIHAEIQSETGAENLVRCPVKVHFKAAVLTKNASAILYRWERSGGPDDTVVKRAYVETTFVPPSYKHAPIEDTRTVGAPGVVYEGWQRLVVVGLHGAPELFPGANSGLPDHATQEVRYRLRCVGPDLALVSIVRVPVSSPTPCKGEIYRFEATVKNQGTWESPDVEVWVVSQDHNVPNRLTKDRGWGNSARIRALQPGESATAVIRISDFAQDPGFMGSQPHRFSVVVDPLGSVGRSESNRTNNSSVIEVAPPSGCPMRPGDAPVERKAPGVAPQPQPQSGAPAERSEPPPPIAAYRPSGAPSKKDAPNCSDHPLFTRLQDYWIESCIVKPLDSYNFDAGTKRNKVEGKYWYLRYQPPPGLSTKPSTAQVLREASTTIKNAGGEIVAADSSKETLRLVRDGRETWIEAWADHTGKYILTIVEAASGKKNE